MKVCIIAVCHNSYEATLNYLNSVYVALREANVELDLFLVDNSLVIDYKMVSKIRDYNSPRFNVIYAESENLGYFPSAIAVIDLMNINTLAYQYLAISNVDIALAPNFFSELELISVDSNIGVFAPSISSEIKNVDRNPKICIRPSATKLKLNRLLFSNVGFYFLLRLGNNFRLKFTSWRKLIGWHQSKPANHFSNETIYAAHGSFVLLTNEFLKRVGNPDYPMFLFGEEIYIAESAKQHELSTIFIPSLKIFDSEHVSTSLMPSKLYREWNINALDYILSKYKF